MLYVYKKTGKGKLLKRIRVFLKGWLMARVNHQLLMRRGDIRI